MTFPIFNRSTGETISFNTKQERDNYVSDNDLSVYQGELPELIVRTPEAQKIHEQRVKDLTVDRNNPEAIYRMHDRQAMSNPASPYNAAKGWIMFNAGIAGTAFNPYLSALGITGDLIGQAIGDKSADYLFDNPDKEFKLNSDMSLTPRQAMRYGTGFVLGGALAADGKNIMTSLDPRNLNGTIGQYSRYYFRPSQFRNARLPTVYRKFKDYNFTTGYGLPQVRRGKIQLSNPESRFLNSNNRRIPWTNTTTDVPVRSHSSDWDSGFTIAIPGKSLLGKKIISTEPSDTFFPNSLQIPSKKAIVLSGDPAVQAWASRNQLQTVRNTALDEAYNKAINSTTDKLDFSNVAFVERQVARQTFGNPSKIDYDFMDYVFRPKYESGVHSPFYVNGQHPDKWPSWYGPLFGNTSKRKYLTNPKEWGNVMYDPMTPTEWNYRDLQGIKVLPLPPKIETKPDYSAFMKYLE